MKTEDAPKSEYDKNGYKYIFCEKVFAYGRLRKDETEPEYAIGIYTDGIKLENSPIAQFADDTFVKIGCTTVSKYIAFLAMNETKAQVVLDRDANGYKYTFCRENLVVIREKDSREDPSIDIITDALDVCAHPIARFVDGTEIIIKEVNNAEYLHLKARAKGPNGDCTLSAHILQTTGESVLVKKCQDHHPLITIVHKKGSKMKLSHRLDAFSDPELAEKVFTELAVAYCKGEIAPDGLAEAKKIKLTALGVPLVMSNKKAKEANEKDVVGEVVPEASVAAAGAATETAEVVLKRPAGRGRGGSRGRGLGTARGAIVNAADDSRETELLADLGAELDKCIYAHRDGPPQPDDHVGHDEPPQPAEHVESENNEDDDSMDGDPVTVNDSFDVSSPCEMDDENIVSITSLPSSVVPCNSNIIFVGFALPDSLSGVIH